MKEQFIDEESIHHINIDYECWKTIMDKIANKTFSKDMFRQAKDAVFRLMEESPFPRFSKQYLAR
jgi:hypothetical protein